MVMVIMEGNPSPIKTFLKQYQLSAANTLNGPSPFLSLHRTMSSSSTSSISTQNGSNPSSVASSPSQPTTPISAQSPVGAAEDVKSGSSGSFHTSNILQKHLMHSGKRFSADAPLKSLSQSSFLINGHIKKEKFYPEEYKNRSSLSPSSPTLPLGSAGRGGQGQGQHIRRNSGDPNNKGNCESSDLNRNHHFDRYTHGGGSGNSSNGPGLLRSKSISGHEINSSSSSHHLQTQHHHGSGERGEELSKFGLTSSSLHISPVSSRIVKPVAKYKDTSLWHGTTPSPEFLPPSTPKRSILANLPPLAVPSRAIGGLNSTGGGTTRSNNTNGDTTISRRPSGGHATHLQQQLILRQNYNASSSPRSYSPPQFLPPPIFIAPDRCVTEMTETMLEADVITCFEVGGEKRLCFPQILNTVLRGFLLPEINKECDEMQIICSPCSREQLDILKACKKLPPFAQSCGLITKSDAERLVNALLHKNPPKPAVPFHRHPKSGHYFRVYHKCFGKAKGIVRTSLYTQPEALCIECVDCHGLFAPPRFVAHSHHRSENKTCHWGFDSANWRNYLLLSKEYEDASIWEPNLNEFKSKFQEQIKEEPGNDEEEDGVVAAKKFRPDPMTESLSGVRSQKYDTYCPNHKTGADSSPYNEHNGVTVLELETVKAMLTSRLGREGAHVNMILDKLTDKISHLEQICREKDKLIKQLSNC